MCGRATVVNPDGITEKVYGFTKKFVPSDWKPRYNLNPREEIPAVYYDPFLRQRVLRTMHWNLIPSSVGDKEKATAFDSQYSAFNARIETVASARIFCDPWRTQRCLVVVDGMIEWVGEKRRKIPHLIRRNDGKPFAMAGVWDRWRGNADDIVWSCAVVVKDADDWYRRFHHRMPVLLDPAVYDEWLNPLRRNRQLDLLSSSPFNKEKELEFFPISTRVNNPGDDAPECLVRAVEDVQQDLLI